jgi:predicted phage terminase large subunit-like protein
MTSTKEGVYATPIQRAFVACNDPCIAMVAGYGAGKTKALIYRIINRLVGNVSLAYYLPTFDHVRTIGWPRLLEQLESLGATVKTNLSYPKVMVPGYGEVLFRSMDRPERIVGYEVADSFFDELDTLSTEKAEQVWIKAMARNRARRPDGRPNTMAVATTPEGFRFCYAKWGRDPQPGYTLFRAKTVDNPYLDMAYVEGLRSAYPSAILQAYLNGEFVNLSGGLIQPGWIRHESKAPEGLRLAMGVDLAISEKEGADYTAIVVLGRDNNGNIHIVDAQRTKSPFNEVLEFIKRKAVQHKPVTIAIEQVQYQAAVVQELLRKTSLPVRGVRPDRDKQARFMPLAARYEQGLVWHAGTFRDYEDELTAFPHGAHDDCVDAAAHAFAALNTASSGVIAPAGKRIF